MSDIFRRICELSDERARLYARCPWTDADRSRLSDLEAEIAHLYRQYNAERCGADLRSVPHHIRDARARRRYGEER